jgi:hypothetical protein
VEPEKNMMNTTPTINRVLFMVATSLSRERAGETLIDLADHAFANRDWQALDQITAMLSAVPGLRAISSYYKALSVNKGGVGDPLLTTTLLNQALDNAPVPYKARAFLSLAALASNRADQDSQVVLTREALRVATNYRERDLYTALVAGRMSAVLMAADGNHAAALDSLNALSPLASAVRPSHPGAYYDYLNSVAVELMETRQFEAASRVIVVPAASVLAPSNPAWAETAADITARTSNRTLRLPVGADHSPIEPGNRSAPEKTPQRDRDHTQPGAPARIIRFPASALGVIQQKRLEIFDIALDPATTVHTLDRMIAAGRADLRDEIREAQ